jgi:branched-chain amino acid transport system permease protein
MSAPRFSRRGVLADRRAQLAAKVVLFGAIALAVITAPSYLTSVEQSGLLVTSAIYAVMALSLAFIMGQTGQWSFGHQAFLGIGAYASALLSTRLDVPVLVGFVIAMVISGIAGLIVGYVALSRTRGMYLAIVTVAFGVMVNLVGLNWYSLTGGPLGLYDLPFPTLELPGLGKIEFFTDTSYYYLALAILAVVAYTLARISDSRRGLALRALRNNETLARSVGISPLRYYVGSFALGSALAGLAGALLVHYLSTISPALMSFDYLFLMLTMVILGGMATYVGPVIGAVIVAWVPALLGVSDSVRALIFSLMIAIVVPFLPDGLYPAARDLARAVWRRLLPEREEVHAEAKAGAPVG